MNTPISPVDFTPHSLHTFQSHRARGCTLDLPKKMCVLGDPHLGEGLFNWMHDCQDTVFVSTGLFKKRLGTCNIHFGLQVESEPMHEKMWAEDVNLFLDMHSRDTFWNSDLNPPQQWRCLTVLKMNTTPSRCGNRQKHSINNLVKTLNASNQSIFIQSVYRLDWYQPKRGPTSEMPFFDPEMVTSFVPRHRPAPARKIFHLLLVYSDRPVGSFVKTLIQQAVLGTVPGKPQWFPIYGSDLETLTPKGAFSSPQCLKAKLRVNPMGFKSMLTGNLLQNDEHHKFFGPMM